MAETGRAVVSVAALAAFVVGVPVANVATGGAFDHLAPAALPDLHDPDAVWQAVRWSYLDGHLVPWLAHVALWLGWALGVVLVLLDIARLVRAGNAALQRHLAARTPRAWITSAVASALLLFSASNAVAQPTGVPVVATAHQDPGPVAPRIDPYHLPDDLRPDCPRHVVVHGDTYWSLAEQHLGDGRRYIEIDALNHDRIADARALRPGMKLLLPLDATNLVPPVPDRAKEVIVRPGETASAIAQREYGDATLWTRLWDLNRLRPQPDGRAWRTPDLLLPGWRLLVTEPTAAPAPSPPPSPPATPPSAPSPSAVPPTSSRMATPTPGPTHSSAPSSAVAVTLPTGAFVGIGLTALVTAAVFTVRLRHRRHRPHPRQRDTTTAPAVRALRVEYDRATLPRDADGGLQYLDPAPDEATRRDDAIDLADRVLPAEETPLGVHEGQLAAMDLAAAGGLGLDGPGAIPATRALLVTLYGQHHAEIIIPATCVPLLFDTADLASTAAMTITPDTTAALDLVNGRPELATTDTSTVLVLNKVEPSTQARLEDLLKGSQGRLLAILLGAWPSGTTITVAADGRATSSGTRLFTLPAADAADLLALFQEAQDIDEPAADEFTAIASDTEPAHPAVLPAHLHEPRELQLEVLGRQHLSRPGTDQDLIGVLAPRQREILIYLALYPNGCRRETLTADLWPDAPIDRPHNAFHATLSQMRTALRKATDGTVGEITTNIDGHFGINPDLVTVDLWELQNALTRTRHALTDDDRLTALQEVANLYTGRLADGFAAGWVEAPREEIHRAALGAISQLVRAVGQHDPSKMIPLLEHARELDPYNENIYRDLMRVHARLGQHDSIQRTLTLLATMLAEIDERPTDDTVQLARALSAQRGA
jgi:DNA-binding SARP family transcriptional activator